MAFIFTCGTHTFSSLLKGYEHITAQCQNCGNFSARVIKRWEWFTFCFVPIVPFSLKPWHEVGCHICHFHQDLSYRPDVQAQMNGQSGQQVPMQNYPQGWNQQSQHSHPPPQAQGYGGQQYHQPQQGQMAYK